MTKLCVLLNDSGNLHVLDADRISKDETFLYAYQGEDLVGIFDLSIVLTAYMSVSKK